MKKRKTYRIRARIRSYGEDGGVRIIEEDLKANTSDGALKMAEDYLVTLGVWDQEQVDLSCSELRRYVVDYRLIDKHGIAQEYEIETMSSSEVEAMKEVRKELRDRGAKFVDTWQAIEIPTADAVMEDIERYLESKNVRGIELQAVKRKILRWHASKCRDLGINDQEITQDRALFK